MIKLTILQFKRRGETFFLNETGGHLLRTKSVETNEGGVASGFSALDSIYLVDDEANTNR
jgi:hypothetical protein